MARKKVSQAKAPAKSRHVDVSKHVLVPRHTVLSEKEKDKLLKGYGITLDNLPSIALSDPAIATLGPSVDDVVRVERQSPTAKVHHYYRRVING